jgi:hypothetical protein
MLHDQNCSRFNSTKSDVTLKQHSVEEIGLFLDDDRSSAAIREFLEIDFKMWQM